MSSVLFQGWTFSSHQIFPGFISFSMIFIKIFKIPWFFQVISHLSRSSGNPVMLSIANSQSIRWSLFLPRNWVKSSKNQSTFTTKIFRHLTKQQKVHCFNIDVANLPSLSLVYPTTFLREYSNHPRLPSQHRPLVTSTFKTRNQDRLSTFQINPQICCIPVHVLQFCLICFQN